MNRHLIWIIAGTSVLGLGVPAFAAARSDGSPDDNGVPGELRGNCDEAEHANDPNCLAIAVPGAIVVTVPSTTPSTVTTPSTTSESSSRGTIPSETIPGNTTPSTTSPGNRASDDMIASNAEPGTTVPGTSVANSNTVDVSGPCDEAEHANDPRCTGVDVNVDDDVDDVDDVDDDSALISSDDDDHSGHGHDGSDDDASDDDASDDNSGSGHGGSDD